MDFSFLTQALHSNMTIFAIVVSVLLVVSEVLGTNENIKASAIYGVIKAVILTLKEQAMPQKPADSTQTSTKTQ